MTTARTRQHLLAAAAAAAVLAALMSTNGARRTGPASGSRLDDPAADESRQRAGGRKAVQPRAARAEPVSDPAQSASTRAELALPGDHRLPALNGARDPLPPAWPPGLPWSEPSVVVGPDGVAWYVHEGFAWTTLEIDRPDLGRADAVTLSAERLPDTEFVPEVVRAVPDR